MESKDNEINNDDSNGVLLYYKYVPILNIESLVSFYESNCKSLGLLGRVRIASNGVNVTVGGKMPALEKHIEVMKCDELFEGTDYKLASCDEPSDDRIAQECGFTDLAVRVVKELVTFRSDPSLKPPEILRAGRHLSATEFHCVLQDAGKSLDSQASMQQRQLLLLDARNLYETRIGKFQNPNVETLDPEIRQYSDLAAWIDEHSEQLRGKQVLMYCTGGIRCETASAYIKSKGAGYENIFQLYGGIQRYLEQFPDGGFFRGKNFVFDHRVSVGSKDTDIVGACLICGTSFDDYSSRCRCTYCRMLVLVCYSCQEKTATEYVCELCKQHREGGRPLHSRKNGQLHLSDSHEPGEVEHALPSVRATPSSIIGKTHQRKLRILCLHGFRQNTSNFKGRTASLAKKLKNMAEFVFINGPHELPFIYHSTEQTTTHQQPPPPLDKCKKRFAWLIDSKTVVEEPFNPLQYLQQTDGFDESYNFLKKAISKLGPFDGVLGFSQGSAMVAMFLEQQQRTCETRDFRFAVLCSGFSVASEDFGKEIIECPSLHVFGDGRGNDRQIDCEASRKLADLFAKGCSVVIEHDFGHIIPTRSPYIDEMKQFLVRFL